MKATLGSKKVRVFIDAENFPYGEFRRIKKEVEEQGKGVFLAFANEPAKGNAIEWWEDKTVKQCPSKDNETTDARMIDYFRSMVKNPSAVKGSVFFLATGDKALQSKFKQIADEEGIEIRIISPKLWN